MSNNCVAAAAAAAAAVGGGIGLRLYLTRVRQLVQCTSRCSRRQLKDSLSAKLYEAFSSDLLKQMRMPAIG
eukprot:scaffold407103_cov22-Prasinocladus_malaysianus.AAC.1